MLDGSEVHDVAYPVHSAADNMIVIQSTELLFTVVLLYIDQLSHSLQSDPRIVLAHHSNIMLSEHAPELRSVFLD